MRARAILHRGHPVEFGAEKEYNLRKMKAGEGKLAFTRHTGFDASVFGPRVPGELLLDRVERPDREVTWAALNDAGKAQYALRYREATGAFPKLSADPSGGYARIDFESNGWIELVSSKLDDLSKLRGFVDTYGWGHIHVSFMRGAPVERQRELLSWLAMANLWSFIHGLEERGPSGNGEVTWRFSIKGLSIPTEEHLLRFGEILGGRNLPATAFHKHLLVNLRGNGRQYGQKERIGVEVRGGHSSDKKRLVESLLNALSDETKIGQFPFGWGQVDFRLPRLGQDAKRSGRGGVLQPKRLPRDFLSLALRHLEGEGGSVDPNRLFRFVSGARLGPGGTSARLEAFDQRALVPLLAYESLPFLTPEEGARGVKARSSFLERLGALEASGLSGTEAGEAIARLIGDWAKEARLSGALLRYLDGERSFL